MSRPYEHYSSRELTAMADQLWEHEKHQSARARAMVVEEEAVAPKRLALQLSRERLEVEAELTLRREIRAARKQPPR